MSRGDSGSERDGLPSLRELEVLRAMIASRKTIAAAQMLGVSQPAVSRAIATLEERTGRRLFAREGGRLTPTAEAFALEEQSRPIFTALERIGRWPDADARGGALRVIASPTLAQFLLPDIVARFRLAQGRVVVNVEIGTNAAVVAAVADRLADIGVVDTPNPHPAVRAEVFREALAHCLMPAGHPLSGRETVTARDLADEPIIALARRFPSRIEAERVFGDAGVTMRVAAETATSSFALELVQRGVGLALLNPFPLTLGGMKGLVARPFEPAIAYRTMLLFPAFGAVSPTARQFADMLKREQPDDGCTIPIR